MALMQYYSVVDASQGQVFLAVYEDIQYTDLYISDQKGMHYSLSLRNINPRDVTSTNENVVYDLHKVKIIDAIFWCFCIYIATVLIIDCFVRLKEQKEHTLPMFLLMLMRMMDQGLDM